MQSPAVLAIFGLTIAAAYGGHPLRPCPAHRSRPQIFARPALATITPVGPKTVDSSTGAPIATATFAVGLIGLLRRKRS